MTVKIRQSMVIRPAGESALRWAGDWVKAWTAQGWQKTGMWSDRDEVVAEITCETEVGDAVQAT